MKKIIGLVAFSAMGLTSPSNNLHPNNKLGGFTTFAKTIDNLGHTDSVRFDTEHIKPGNYYKNVLIYIPSFDIKNTISREHIRFETDKYRMSGFSSGKGFIGDNLNSFDSVYAVSDDDEYGDYDSDPCDGMSFIPYDKGLWDSGNFYQHFERPNDDGRHFPSFFSFDIHYADITKTKLQVSEGGYKGGKYSRQAPGNAAGGGALWVVENCYFWKEVQTHFCAWSGEFPKQRIFLFDRMLSITDWAIEKSMEVK